MGKFQIKTGLARRPHATIFTGRSGIGKTFFASTIPGRFFIPVEHGLMGLSPDHAESTPRFADEHGRDVLPRTLGALFEMFAVVRAEARNAGWRHLVVDGLSGIERLVNFHTCKAENVQHMESKDFAKVYGAAIPHWQRVQAELDLVRDAGLHVWLIAHSQESSDSTVEGDRFTKWDLALQGSGKALESLRQLWRGWADHVLFLDWEAQVTRGDAFTRKTVGKYTSRILRTRETPSHYAKNRGGLPPTLPATWPDLHRALVAGAPAKDTQLRAQIEAAMRELTEDDRAAIAKDLEEAKTIHALSAVLSRAQGMLSVARQESADAPPLAESTTAPVAPAEEPPPPDEPEPEPEAPSAPPPAAKAKAKKASPPPEREPGSDDE